jgi:hypothetical protein
MAKIFDHVLELKTHLHPNGSSTSKEVWIELYNLCFNGDNRGAGLLACHNYWMCPDNHLRLKSLVEKNAEYFYNQALKRQERDKDNAEYTACESCGRTIYLERKRALERWRDLKKREKNARESDQTEKERAQQYLGALPQSRGIGAPPGFDLRSSDDRGLLALGKLSSSKNGQYMNIFVGAKWCYAK